MAEASANAIDRDVHEIKAIGETVWQPELVPGNVGPCRSAICSVVFLYNPYPEWLTHPSPKHRAGCVEKRFLSSAEEAPFLLISTPQ